MGSKAHGVGPRGARPHAREVLRTLAVAIAALCVPAALAQVSSAQIRKQVHFEQVSETQLRPRATSPSSFRVDVEGSNLESITPPTVSGPFNVGAIGAAHNGGTLVYSTADRSWRYGPSGEVGASSIPALDSLFGNGTYTLTLPGATVSLALTGDAYPNPPPVLSLSGGRWSDGAYVIESDKELVITTSTYTAYGTHRNDVICAFVLGLDSSGGIFGSCPGTVARASDSPTTRSVTHRVAANRLVAGQPYTIIANFHAIVDSRSPAALNGVSPNTRYVSYTRAKLTVVPPKFGLAVTSSFANGVANVSATFQPRPQDVGTNASIYVFAIAPVTVVKRSLEKAQGFGHIARGDLDTPVQCVLAQLSSNGQLTGVSASNMQAYVSGVLSGQGQAITLLNGVPVANVAGATFYVGYGPTASAMLDSGLNRSAVTAPGSVQCKPEAPQAGWWWNPAEGGRGYSIEVQGDNIFFAAFHYDVSGRSTWHVATGATSLDGSLYSNQPLYAARGGQTLGGAYPGRPTLAEIGKITLAFADARTGTMIWPGGAVPIERFNIVPNGLAAAPKENQPESGWWWNPEESGRGFFMEWQNGTIDLAAYMYDDQGNPVWYLGVYDTPNMRAMSGNWWSYANGQTMTSSYKPATRINDHVAPVTITFSGPDTALMTLPNGRTTQLRRHRF